MTTKQETGSTPPASDAMVPPTMPWTPRSERSEFVRTFVRRYVPAISAWPVVTILLGCLLWIWTFSTLDREQMKAHHEATKQATSLARSYAHQLKRSVEHMDQITRSLKYEWEESKVRPDLERQREKGLFTGGQQLYASIIAADGALLTSTLPIDGKQNFSDSENQKMHRANSSNELFISGPGISRRIGRPIVIFSRRLETPGGEFDGVVLMAAEPSYLSAFQDESLLNKNDFVSVRYIAGPLLATKVGQSKGVPTIFYRHDPLFPGNAGVMLEPGDRFKDNTARFVAWQKLEKYPLVAVAALSVEDALAAQTAATRHYKVFATVGSVLLFLLGTGGALFSARLAWRRLQAEEIERTYQLAVDAAREGFYMLRPLYDRDGRAADFQVEDCNERGAEMIGTTKTELIGKRVSDLYSDQYLEWQLDKMRHGLEAGFFEDEMRVSPQSRMQGTWMHRRVVRSGGALALTIRDISEVKMHEQELSNMANADALTSLPNRNWLANYLPLAIERAGHNGTRLVILFIDLDDFKNVNDTLGHAAGDDLLKAAATRLRSLVRASDHVIRLGGDEFTVVVEDLTRIDDVSRIAQQIISALGEPFTLGRSSGNRIHASIGISHFPQDGSDGETLLKHADVAMYAAKAAGKGRFQFYHADLSDRLVLRLNREQALRQAIDRDEFVLHYQPRVDALTGKLCSMEALVRWMHPERGLVHPLEFVEVAEDTGLILELGRSVIEKACAQIARWKEEGLPVVPVSINVSALQFNEGNVKDTVAACLRRYGVEASLIGVELTESCMAGDDDMVSAELDGLRTLGVKILVDDFGTGYSSLSQLQRLNVDVLKVDRAFTLSLSKGVEGKALFKAIVSMADALNICIVAEGVETPEQLGELQSLACDEVQGYLVSQPVPAKDVSQLIHKRFLFPPSVQQSKVVPI